MLIKPAWHYHLNTNYDNEAISYHAGFIAEIKLTDGFAIQPELLYYSRRGNL
jgi:hypothetical protein